MTPENHLWVSITFLLKYFVYKIIIIIIINNNNSNIIILSYWKCLLIIFNFITFKLVLWVDCSQSLYFLDANSSQPLYFLDTNSECKARENGSEGRANEKREEIKRKQKQQDNLPEIKDDKEGYNYYYKHWDTNNSNDVILFLYSFFELSFNWFN